MSAVQTKGEKMNFFKKKREKMKSIQLNLGEDEVEILKEAITEDRVLTKRELMEIRDELIRHRTNEFYDPVFIQIEEEEKDGLSGC